MNANIEWRRYRGQKVALVIPCYNEEAAIAKVINDFKNSLPEIRIFVFNNNSTDRTIDVAKTAGAEIFNVVLRGKGNVVRRMFADVDADVFVMVDGDATYDAATVKPMIDKLLD